jgi:hypothetical protein
MRDNVNQDIRLLGERNLKSLAMNRKEGKKLLKEAGPTEGCRISDNDDELTK